MGSRHLTWGRVVVLCIGALTTSGALQPARAQKTDTVMMRNGDVVTVEIKQLERGRLEASTDGMGTLLIEWDDIERLASPARFEVRTRQGGRHVGALGSTPVARELVVDAPMPVTLAFDDVVALAPANPGFWSQWEGSIDLGYDFATAGETTQWSLTTSVERRAERLETRITGDSFFSAKEGAKDTSRHALALNLLRFVGARWGLVGLGQVERNEELQLAHRVQAGWAYQYRFLQTNAAVFGMAAGVAVNREKFLDDTPGQSNVEAVLATRVEAFTFDTPKTDLTTAVVVFPVLSDVGRTRIEVDVSVRRELARDFYFSVGLQNSFDSEPPSQNAARNDFHVVSAFGWSF